MCGHNEYCERLMKYERRTWISRFMGMKHIIILGDGMADWPVKSLESRKMCIRDSLFCLPHHVVFQAGLQQVGEHLDVVSARTVALAHGCIDFSS